MKTENNLSVLYIDGYPYDVSIPDEKSWTEMLAVLGDNNPMKRPDGMYCWCQDSIEGWSMYRQAVRFQAGQYQDKPTRRVLECSIYSDIGFRPILTPLDPDTLKEAPERLDGLENGTVIAMGSLKMNGIIQYNPEKPSRYGDIPPYKDGAELSIGSTPASPVDAIRWVVCNGTLWADRIILRDVTWTDLDRNGLVFQREHDHSLQTDKKPDLSQRISSAEQKAASQQRPKSGSEKEGMSL